MTPLSAEKRAARERAMTERAAAHAAGFGAAREAAAHALDVLAAVRGVATVSAYLPIRSELDPMPLMLALAGLGYRLCVPMIVGRGLPLRFLPWTPGAATRPGPFGVAVPDAADHVEPDALFVPMLAFDARCHRLGYGGGYYDRTIAALRASRHVHAFGFAYAAQQVENLPVGNSDMRLDAIVTEAGVVRPA